MDISKTAITAELRKKPQFLMGDKECELFYNINLKEVKQVIVTNYKSGNSIAMGIWIALGIILLISGAYILGFLCVVPALILLIKFQKHPNGVKILLDKSFIVGELNQNTFKEIYWGSKADCETVKAEIISKIRELNKKPSIE